jgi:hypothetical protein
MTNPITPSPELVQQLRNSAGTWLDKITIAYQAGADQELDAVEEEIITQGWFANSVHRRAQLRAARRPKPPTRKEQALEALERMQDLYPHMGNARTIRFALEALPE